jgi:hypothetical protein
MLGPSSFVSHYTEIGSFSMRSSPEYAGPTPTYISCNNWLFSNNALNCSACSLAAVQFACSSRLARTAGLYKATMSADEARKAPTNLPYNHPFAFDAFSRYLSQERPIFFAQNYIAYEGRQKSIYPYHYLPIPNSQVSRQSRIPMITPPALLRDKIFIV